MLIAIEGIDGVGKTTTSRRLAERRNYQYYKSFSEKFKHAHSAIESDLTDLGSYFFFRASNQYDSEQVRTLLRNGPVITDRYVYSTLSYHIAMNKRIQELASLIDLEIPRYVIVLKCTEQERVRRLAQREQPIKSIEMNRPVLAAAEAHLLSFATLVIDNSSLPIEGVLELIEKHIDQG